MSDKTPEERDISSLKAIKQREQHLKSFNAADDAPTRQGLSYRTHTQLTQLTQLRNDDLPLTRPAQPRQPGSSLSLFLPMGHSPAKARSCYATRIALPFSASARR